MCSGIAMMIGYSWTLNTSVRFVRLFATWIKCMSNEAYLLLLQQWLVLLAIFARSDADEAKASTLHT